MASILEKSGFYFLSFLVFICFLSFLSIYLFLHPSLLSLFLSIYLFIHPSLSYLFLFLFFFLILLQLGLEVVLYCCAIIAMCGAVLTVLTTLETRGRSLEEIEQEHLNAKSFCYYMPWNKDRRRYDSMANSEPLKTRQ
jgi:hypothetical protein